MPLFAEQISNLSSTTLSGNGGSITSGATSMIVANNGTAPFTFPNLAAAGAQFHVIIDQEIILVTAGPTGSTTWTIARGQEGTTAASHTDGTPVYLVGSAASMQQMFREVGTDQDIQKGVVGSGDLAVTGTLTAASSVTVASGTAYLPDSNGFLARHVQLTNNTTAATLGAAPASNTYRVDVLYAVYNGWNLAPTYSYVAGTQQSPNQTVAGAYTTTGIGSAPANSIAIALFVFNNVAGVTTIYRFDRRPWTRGAFAYQSITANVATSSTTLVGVSSSLGMRIECSGTPIRCRLLGQASHNTTNGVIQFSNEIDGTITGVNGYMVSYVANDAGQSPLLDVITTPSAGSHFFQPYWLVATGTATLTAAAAWPVVYQVEELVRSNVNNGTV